MRRSVVWFAVGSVWAITLVGIGARPLAQHGGKNSGGKNSGWTLPEGADNEKNPLTVNDAVLAGGKKIFGGKCQKCHGPAGKGDGPDADKKHIDHMNLTNPANADHNPDGVVFYKIWNGRSSPKMPRFSEELTREQAWAVVAYVQTLRGKK
jgi:mono/diheme cytochrome c family protein